MPSPSPRLTEDQARAFVRSRDCSPSPESLVGVELEWLVHDASDPARPLTLEEIRKATCDTSDFTGRITFEPGGQIEISSLPYRDPRDALESTAFDVALLCDRTAAAGLVLDGSGRDRWRTPARVLHHPRYAAMERYLRHGDDPDVAGAGPTMMCNTASVQVNVGLGRDPSEVWRRWHLVHRIGPVLAAAFANSPLDMDGPTGLRSSRLAAWFAIDPSRTAAVESYVPPALSWPEYAMGAQVMFIRRDAEEFVPQLDRFTFTDWLADGHSLGHPTEDDLAYHMTTLFPPVRPRGWLELRMLDALPPPWWQVPLLVVTALLDDSRHDDALCEATAGTEGRWDDAARHGLSDPDFAASAAACFGLAVSALVGRGDQAQADLVAAYASRYVYAGRTPADDVLDDWVASAGAGSHR